MIDHIHVGTVGDSLLDLISPPAQRRWRMQIVTCLAAFLTLSGMLCAAPDFEHEVAPILINRCLECHHPGKASGGLNLSTLAGLQKGGDSGPAIVIEDAKHSLIVARIESGEMPPPDKKERVPVTEKEVAMLREWIALGAKWPEKRELGLHEQTVALETAREFWSYRPIVRPEVPHVAEERENIHPIDAFIRAQLAEKGLKAGARALPRQLLRRAWLDLIGLPPSLEEQQSAELETDQRYAELVDRLLEQPGYGERWARYWLDLVRYADSNGYERDGSKPSVWRYRDYVIRSLNEDKPYNRFVMEQIAGDELSDRTAETVIATGFHALGTWQDEVDPLEAAQYRADELDDMLRTTAQTFLGVTIGCARCHNHKFDPISMVDYYSLAAVLSPLQRPNTGRDDRDLPAGTSQELEAIRVRDAKIDEAHRTIERLRQQAQMEWIARGESRLPAEAVEAFKTPHAQRTPAQTQLAQKHAAEWNAELEAFQPADRKQLGADQHALIEHLRRETPELTRAYFMFETTANPPPTYLLLSGRASNPGPEMKPGVPVALTESQPDFKHASQSSSGRRLAFANWIVDPNNPLTARVIVNRVWQHHFGEGLVATPSDFGRIGARPTHPELLDWLAHWFVHDANWSLKKLHKLIMTSETYCTTSIANARQIEIDPENKLLARFPHRRLDVETIRDAILATSGKLNREMSGPAVYLPIPASVIEAHTDKDAAWRTSPEPAIYRRTIYGYVKRTLLVPMLEVLDLCDTTNSTEKRAITSIAPQALTLYNGDFVNQQAAFFADRIEREAGSDPVKQIDFAYRVAIGRAATENEIQALLHFLTDEATRESETATPESRRAALVQMARVILNLNEFVYVE